MVKVKFCGIRREEDVAFLNRLKPDFAGFVFAKSPRQVTPEQAAVLRQKLDPAIQTVAVLVNMPAEEAAALANEGIANLLQLHGDEDDAYIAKLKTLTDAKIIKAIRLREEKKLTVAYGKAEDTVLCVSETDRNRLTDAAQEGAEDKMPCTTETNSKRLAEAEQADYYLFDTFMKDAYGGTGKTFSLSLLNRRPIDKPFFLAGGLHAENIADIVEQIRGNPKLQPYFYGVDVSGGIETDGYKDARKMEAFMKAIGREV